MQKHISWGLEIDECGNGDSHILDKHWGVHCIDPRTLDPRIIDFYPTLDCELSISIAGKENEPDRLSFALAIEVLEKLYSHLQSISTFDLADWNPVNISFPYQNDSKLWFVEFRSEYDGTLEFSFYLDPLISDAYDVNYTHVSEGTYQDTPRLAKWAIDELSRHLLDNSDLRAILQRVEDEKIVGYEILGQLATLMESNLDRLRGNINEQLFQQMRNTLPLCARLT